MGEGLYLLASKAPAGRPAQPSEIAAAALYLAGDDAAFVHGATLRVDGGRTAV
jgi:NAD(P)-dependent dehydrogenase (short-subunit alcohol dehydrogenase family)